MAAVGMATELLHPALREPARLVGAAREMVPMAAVVWAAVMWAAAVRAAAVVWAAAVRAAAVQTVTMAV